MTPQEISMFVNHPAPRDVTKNILRDANKFGYRHSICNTIAILFLLFILLSISYPGMLWDIVLNSGFKSTAQGVVLGWERTLHGKISKIIFSINVRFSALDGDVTAYCYADNEESIPGWEQIPEVRGGQLHNELISLKEPFPVEIEYYSLSPSNARAAGTRVSQYSVNDVLNVDALLLIITIVLLLAMHIRSWHSKYRMKLVLTEGHFTTGQISKPIRKGLFHSVAVSFSDQNDKKRTIIYRTPSQTMVTLLRWADEGRQEVSLLYLPNGKFFFITDLLET
jgi:hypothetical protein